MANDKKLVRTLRRMRMTSLVRLYKMPECKLLPADPYEAHLSKSYGLRNAKMRKREMAEQDTSMQDRDPRFVVLMSRRDVKQAMEYADTRITRGVYSRVRAPRKDARRLAARIVSDYYNQG